MDCANWSAKIKPLTCQLGSKWIFASSARYLINICIFFGAVSSRSCCHYMYIMPDFPQKYSRSPSPFQGWCIMNKHQNHSTDRGSIIKWVLVRCGGVLRYTNTHPSIQPQSLSRTTPILYREFNSHTALQGITRRYMDAIDQSGEETDFWYIRTGRVDF